MVKIPTKLEMAQYHAMNAPFGKMRDEADKQLEIETEKRLQRLQKPRKNLEEDLQIACCKFLDLHPRILYWSTPNHLYRGAQSNTGAFMGYMAKQKRMGLKKGVSDLLMYFKNAQGMPVLCAAELKAGSNKADDDQENFLRAVSAIGGFSGVVKSLDDLQNLLRQAGYSSK